MKIALLILHLACSVAAQQPTAALKDATYVGTTTKIATATGTAIIDKFLGIRFAATPERFRAAQPCAAGSKTVNAVTQPPSCPQQGKYALALPREERGINLNKEAYPTARTASSSTSLPLRAAVHRSQRLSCCGSMAALCSRDLSPVSTDHRRRRTRT